MSASTWPSNCCKSMMLPCAQARRGKKQAHVSLGAREPLCAPNEAHIAPPRRVEGASIALSSRGPGGGCRAAKKLRRERARRGAWPHGAAQRTLDGFGHVAAQQHGAGKLGDDGYAPGAPEGERARRAASGEGVGCVSRAASAPPPSLAEQRGCCGTARQSKQQARADIVSARRESVGCREYEPRHEDVRVLVRRHAPQRVAHGGDARWAPGGRARRVLMTRHQQVSYNRGTLSRSLQANTPPTCHGVACCHYLV